MSRNTEYKSQLDLVSKRRFLQETHITHLQLGVTLLEVSEKELQYSAPLIEERVG